MNLLEARALLGISEDATEIEIRRAYLRKIKTCKPETDPEGFKRIREAYDVANGMRPYFEPDLPHAEQPDAPDPEPTVWERLGELGPTAVAPEIVRLVESAIAEGRVAEIALYDIVHFGLASFAAGRRRRAGALVRKWFAAASQEGVIGPASSSDFPLMAMIELARLPHETPTEFVQVMAEGFLSGIDEACARVVELVGEQPVAGEALRYHVFGSAPVLKLHYGRALRGQGLVSRVTGFFQDHPRLDAAMFVIAVVVFGLLKMCRE